MALETINPPYSTIRGANFLATYPSINADPPQGWAGVQSPAAAWENYDSSLEGTAGEVRDELQRLVQAGFNTIRVWLSYYTWASDQAGYRAKFEHFLGVCASVEIHVIPIIFDSYTESPSAADLASWVADWSSSNGKTFVDDLLTAANNEPSALLMWDIYNEPWVASAPPAADVRTAIEAILSQIKADSASWVTIVGAAGWSAALAQAVAIAGNTNLDCLSIHPYGLSRALIDNLVRDAQALAPGKPIIATELGGPGEASPYEEVIAFCEELPAVESRGIGWILYQAMIGWSDPASQYPHILATGIFYGSGAIREAAPLYKVREQALVHGVAATDLYTRAQIAALVLDPAADEHVVQWPVGLGLGGWSWMLDLLTRPDYRDGFLGDTERDALARCFYLMSSDTGKLAAAIHNPWKHLSRTDIEDRSDEYAANWGTGATYENALLEQWRHDLAPFVHVMNPTPGTPWHREKILQWAK